MRRGARSLAKGLNIILIILAFAMALGLLAMAAGGVLFLIEPAYFEQILAAGLLDPTMTQLDFLISFGTGFFSILAVLLLTLRLRDVLRTVAKGEPFHPDNPRRLRLVAILLAAVSTLTLIGDILIRIRPDERADFNLTAWISVVIVFVLAEVFREGARLKADAELTV